MREEFLKHARVLIVDDEPQNVRYLKDVLEWAGCEHLEGVTEPRRVLSTVRFFEPDLIILDLLMPEMDGFAVLRQLGEELERRDPEEYLPILVLTSDASRETRRRALAMGARDFLTKPMSPTEVRLRVGNLLETRLLYLRCRKLQGRLRDREVEGGEPAGTWAELLESWADWLDIAAGRAPGRARRVARMAERIGRALDLPEEEARRIGRAALLHGLVPQDGDPEPAARLLGSARSSILRTARELVVHGRERWDGGGPGGIAGERIPVSARIVAVAREAVRLGSDDGSSVPSAERLQALEEEAGGRFDPGVVEALTGTRAVTAA